MMSSGTVGRAGDIEQRLSEPIHTNDSRFQCYRITSVTPVRTRGGRTRYDCTYPWERFPAQRPDTGK
jgi:hypothetical protein